MPADVAQGEHGRLPSDYGLLSDTKGRRARKTLNLPLGLAIIDLSAEANQPMQDPAGRVVLAFNGEIYNFRDIRSDLEKGGDRFVTGTDTEVILAAYRRYGIDCLSRFNGMFSFAIWDAGSRSLFLARDRLGVKPLHYALLPDGTVLMTGGGPTTAATCVQRPVTRTPGSSTWSTVVALALLPVPSYT